MTTLILQRSLFTAREKEPHSDTHAPIQPGPNKFERNLAAAGQRRIDAANNGSDTGAEPYGPEHYTVSYDVTNHRDTIAFAHLIWTGQDSVAARDIR
jgi:hypothetical protein